MRFVILSLSFSLGGCMTMTRGPAPMLPIETTPPGAHVLLDGMDRGLTPTELPVIGNQNHVLVLRKECHLDKTVPLKRDFGTMPWFWGNMILPGVGHVVDLASGAAWRVYPQQIRAHLEPSACNHK